ncbi:MAG: hypothetical protein WBZ07_05295, partial [Candidatus Dormiibacterota bacterium]
AQLQPRVARFGSQMVPAGRSLLGRAGPRDHHLAGRLEQTESAGIARWPVAPGRETREQFIGRNLLSGKGSPGELQRLLGLGPAELSGLREKAQRDPAVFSRVGRDYLAAGGTQVHDLDAAYLNALRRGRLKRGSASPSDNRGRL